MKNFILLADALYYIESNLTNPIKTEDIADFLYCSKSTVERLFKYYNNISIRDYIIRRRMNNAAVELTKNPNVSLLELGVRYGYSSNEAFTRSFARVWHATPSEFRKNPRKFELFPGYKVDLELMEEKNMKDKRKVDISKLYDVIQERRGCYVVAGDIKQLIPINEISREAGDIAIITALQRMEEAANDDDIVFRVGGDEFVILTKSNEVKYAEAIVEAVTARNGECIKWENQEIPLSLYVTFFKVRNTPIRYSELFTEIQEEISNIK